MTVYYNEFDPYAAAWLRNLIAAGHIADGVVDERSIVDVRPEDLAGFTQVHFFAGLGGWSHAARLAGWPDDRPLWTGSCPCQPFSLAGKRTGTADERHLWPEMHRLVAAIRPPVVVGEQVASRAGLDWLDAVCADLEGAGYATGAIDLCAASVGAPHIRQRLWWVAYADGRNASAEGLQRGGEYGQQPEDGRIGRGLAYAGSEGRGQVCENTRGGRSGSSETGVDERSMHGGTLRGVAHSPGAGPQRRGSGWGPRQGREGTAAERGGEAGWMADAPGRGRAPFIDAGSCDAPDRGGQGNSQQNCGSGWMGDADNSRSQGRGNAGGSQGLGLKGPQSTRADADGGVGDADSPRHEGDRLQPLHGGGQGREQIGGIAGPGTTGFWSAADWIPCRDGKARPVEPGTFPLAHGISNRVGRLRAYGNAIIPALAAEILIATATLIANRLQPVANGGTDEN